MIKVSENCNDMFLQFLQKGISRGHMGEFSAGLFHEQGGRKSVSLLNSVFHKGSCRRKKSVVKESAERIHVEKKVKIAIVLFALPAMPPPRSALALKAVRPDA